SAMVSRGASTKRRSRPSFGPYRSLQIPGVANGGHRHEVFLTHGLRRSFQMREESSDRAPSPGGFERYFAFTKATVASSIRLLKPHSLSYQLETFTRRPATLVRVASKMLERGSWLKSLETRGSVL